MARRVYVKVVVEHDTLGHARPLSIEWENGRIFVIDKVLDSRMAAATKAGGQGMRYTLRINGRETYLFEDEGLWFVEAK